jgi:enoyl-CoA hydratase
MSVLLSEMLPGGVRLLTLNRPKANVFDIELMESLSAAVKDAEKDNAVRALLLRGTGSIFSAGLDFKAMVQARSESDAQSARFGNSMSQAFLDVWQCPKPTVAALTGHAIAAGFFVAIACDFRYVVESAGQYGMNELSFGAGFPAIAIEIGRYALQRDMPKAIQSAETFGWQEGLRNGSFHASFGNEDQLLAAAAAQAAKIGAMPREAYAHVKAQLLAPYVERVMAESAEMKQRTAEIFQSEETLQALMNYMMNMGRPKA